MNKLLMKCTVLLISIILNAAPAAPPLDQGAKKPAANALNHPAAPAAASATDSGNTAKIPAEEAPQTYRIDRPGTITFTVGIVIKGKVEKPQVMIFLPKEKSFLRGLEFTHSFKQEMNTPLPYVPILE